MMSKLLLICFLFFLSCSHLLLSSSFSFSNSTKICPHGQALALLQFKQSFSIEKYDYNYCKYDHLSNYPKIEYWKEGSDCCLWDGVTCDLVTGHVIELDLSCSWLSGTIHSNSTLFHFPHLQRLNLAFNDFSGSSVLDGFGRFSSLTHLNLSYCGFSGLISPEISHLSNLVSLDLSWNGVVEFSPHGFNSLVQNLTKLQKLHLLYISVSSVFPNSLLNRSSLISLDLSHCGLYGRFPDYHDIHLPKLQLLYLWGNIHLNGNFPRLSENNSLMELVLFSTNFSGELPASIGNLKSLQTLHLAGCQFSGSIPASLGNLTQITSLSLHSNHFSGKIPNIFDNLRNLISLGLSRNNFSGQIPPSIGNLTNLYGLDFCHNQLEGAIPSLENENGFSSLSYVRLQYNLFNGTTPSWLYTLPSLVELDLSHNKFIGRIGEFQFDSLEKIAFSMNELHGSIPTSIFELVNLNYLNLSSNKLSGVLETSKFEKLRNSTFFFSVSHNNLSGEISSLICKASSMKILDLSHNNFGGMLPHCLGNFSKDLSVLNLRRNQFHGIIPQTFLKDNSIRTLDFNNNQLKGLVPLSLVICRELEVLDLGNNMINDIFPHWLGALPKLQVLVLRSNHFHGYIGFSKIKSPFMSLRVIDLSHNDFEGDLPEMYLKSLKATMNIDEGNMIGEYTGGIYYQDSIMVTIKGLEIEFVKILNTFTTIDLSSNKFQGEIPECIGNLHSLRGLNLSHNYLTGHIPLSFKNLKMLESLDLSSNKLSGRIPQELTSLTFLEVLNLSQNHLTRFIPQGNHFQTFGNDSYYGNPGLCGFPLLKRCTTDEVLEPPQEIEAEFESGFDWKITLIGYGCGLVSGFSLGCLIFLSRQPKWLVWIIDKNIHKMIVRNKMSTHRRGTRRS